MLSNISWISRLTSLLFLGSVFLLNFHADRTDFTSVIIFYGVAFASYILLLKRRDLSFTHLLILAISAQIFSMIFVPYLSNDYFRFLWDGEMTWQGINPFDYKPTELINQPYFRGNEYIQELYGGMSELSRRNYTCYPTLNQVYFILASWTTSIGFNVFVLKALIVATELLGGIYLYKLLKHLKIPAGRMWLLFLNPLWIIECTGNVHFEGVMVSFLFIALYFIVSKNLLKGSGFLALAIQIKLIPLIILPFFLRFLGWWKSAILYSITIAAVLVLGLVFINSHNLLHFTESLSLYFNAFEFNSPVYYNLMEYGYSVYGWHPKIYSMRLSQFTTFIILVIAFYGSFNDPKVLFKRITIAIFFYIVLSSTVHPWYIILPLALSILTNYTFPIIWSLLVFTSYYFYSLESNAIHEVRTLVTIEYLLLTSVFIYEIIRKKPLLKF